MGDGVVLLVGVSALLLIVAAIGAASHIYADSGFRMFVWPRLENGYEVQYATRLAAFPWYLTLYLLAANGLAILLFAHDLGGRPTKDWAPWLAAALLPVLMAHLIDYRRSRIAAVLSVMLFAGTAAGLAWLLETWVPLAVALPLVVWSVNGARATFADRTLG